MACGRTRLGGDLGLDLALVPSKRQGSDGGMQDALCEQVQLGAAIAQTLEQLHPTDLPLALSRAPRPGQRGDDRIGILANAPDERSKRWLVRGLRLVEQWLECTDIPRGQEGLKLGLELSPLDQQGIGLQEVLPGASVRLSQASSRLQEELCQLGACLRACAPGTDDEPYRLSEPR